jgi:hypothetical protein
MSTIIGSNTVYFTCDSEKGCYEKTEEYHNIGRNLGEIAQIVRNTTKWFISTVNDTCYCPKHSPHQTNQGA